MRFRADDRDQLKYSGRYRREKERDVRQQQQYCLRASLWHNVGRAISAAA